LQRGYRNSRDNPRLGGLQKEPLIMAAKNYRDLDVWHVAMDLTETTYRLTETFPDHERYGLIAQMRRCSVSIPSNVAEGQARGTARFGLYFIRVALGSVGELDTQVEIARRLKFASVETTRELDAQLDRVRSMLHGMRREHERRLVTAGAAVLSLFFLLRAAGLFT
jgi:four helix bundle protein